MLTACYIKMTLQNGFSQLLAPKKVGAHKIMNGRERVIDQVISHSQRQLDMNPVTQSMEKLRQENNISIYLYCEYKPIQVRYLI